MTQNEQDRIYETARTILPFALAQRAQGKSIYDLHEVDFMAAAEVAVSAAHALDAEVMGARDG